MALIDLRRAQDEAKAVQEEQCAADRGLSPMRSASTRAQLKQQEDEQELRIGVQVEQERQANRLQEHDDDMRDLAERLEEANESATRW